MVHQLLYGLFCTLIVTPSTADTAKFVFKQHCLSSSSDVVVENSFCQKNNNEVVSLIAVHRVLLLDSIVRSRETRVRWG